MRILCSVILRMRRSLIRQNIRWDMTLNSYTICFVNHCRSWDTHSMHQMMTLIPDPEGRTYHPRIR